VEAETIVAKSCSPSPALITLLAIAPKIATPTALPAERANTLTPVTTPRSSQSTEAWAAISVGAAVQPSPKPITNDTAATVTGFG